MEFETKVKISSILFVLAIVGVGFHIGDPTYPIKILKSGNYEPLFILLGLVLGFTMRSGADSDSISALLFGIGMSIFLLLAGGIDLPNKAAVGIGFFLSASFFICMVGTVVFLVRALQHRVRRERETEVSELE